MSVLSKTDKCDFGETHALNLVGDPADRHAAYYLAFAQRHRDDWSAIANELGQIRRAWETVEDDERRTLAFIEAMRPFQDRMGLWREELDWWEQRGLAAVRQLGQSRDEATLLNNIGVTCKHLEEYGRALDRYRQALIVFSELEDPAGQARVLSNAGAACYAAGELEQAVDFYRRALPLHEAAGDGGGKAITLNNLGRIYADLDDLDNALACYKESLALKEEACDRSGTAVTLNNIGLVHEARGEMSEALVCYEQALDIDKELGDSAGTASTLRNMAGVYYLQGNATKAVAVLEEVLDIDEKLGSPDRARDRAVLIRLRTLVSQDPKTGDGTDSG